MDLTVKSLFIVFFSIALIACEAPSEAVATWQHAAGGTSSAAISQDGHFTIDNGFNEPVGWWDLKKNARIFNWRQSPGADPLEDNDPPYFVDISEDGSRALTASLKNFVVWNTETGESTGYYQVPDKIRSIALSNQAVSVLIGFADGRSVFMSLKTGRRLEFLGHRLHAQQQTPPLPGEWIGINSVAISGNGHYALSGGDDHYAILWNTVSGQALYQWPHKGRVHKVALTSDGRFAFTASSKAEAYIWDLQTGKKISQLALKKREWVISSARFSNSGSLLATGSPGRDLKLWQVSSGKLIKAWKVKKRSLNKASGAVVLDVAFSADDSHVISAASSGYVQKWLIPN
jgi:WD40 repeat protein